MPKMTMAMLIHPLPPTTSMRNMFWWARVRKAPPMPMRAPPPARQRVRTRLTLMPTVSAARGFSPTVRMARPQVVRYRRTQSAGIRRNAQ